MCTHAFGVPVHVLVYGGPRSKSGVLSWSLPTFKCMGVLPAHMSMHSMHVAPAKKVLDPLELEFQKIVSCHVGAGDLNTYLCVCVAGTLPTEPTPTMDYFLNKKSNCPQ